MRVLAILIMSILLQVSMLASTSRYYFPASAAGSSAGVVRLGMIEGMSEGADSVFANPASLYRINQLSTSLFTTTFMDEVTYRNAAIALRFSFGTVGVGIMDLGVDDLEKTVKTDAGVDVDSYFNYKNSLLKLAYGFSQSEQVHFGLSGTYYFNKFDTVSASAFNLDFGTVVKFDRLEFSFLVRNMLVSNDVVFADTETGSNSSNGQTENLPLETVYSLKYAKGHFNLYGQLKTIGSERALQKHVALEFKPKFLPVLSLSAGMYQYSLLHYEEGELLDDQKLTASFGMTLNLRGVTFDYAYEKSEHIEFDHKHFFSAGFSF